jgi:triosephosphate isomerase
MSRKIWIAGNWKMNHDPAETEAFLGELRNHPALEADSPRLRAAIFPSHLSLASACQQEVPHLAIGAQNAHWKENGAFTGEVSSAQLKKLGVKIALVGHSERRHLFGETDQLIQERTRGLLEAGMPVMLCVGETREEREAGRTIEVVSRQLEALPERAPTSTDQLVIAYEPVWAIGTGLTATPDQAQEVHAKIRELLAKRWGAEAAEKMSVLYGGSVKPENVDELLEQPDIDGGLIGGASLKPASFGQLLASGAQRAGE